METHRAGSVVMRVEVEQLHGRRFAIRARGNEIVIDDTTEDGGPGDGFRPTELMLGALAACMMGTMISFAEGQGIAVDSVRTVAEDEIALHPERIGAIDVTMTLETDAGPKRQATLERVASACKIHKTLGSSPTVRFAFSATEATT